MFKNKIALIIFCFILFISISSVCASDNANCTALDNHSDVPTGDFSDLKNDINNLNPGDVYNIDKDYVFNPQCPDNGPQIIFGNNGIDISVNNVTINGNGHVIDGNYKTNLFKVTGNNVKIFNLTFINSKYQDIELPVFVEGEKRRLEYSDHIKIIDDMSPIYWTGNNGIISDCTFSHNSALNGGAIKWTGNNGTINNSQFIDNIARGVGGALYIAGANITIANDTFTNSTSLLSGEAIYTDRKYNNYIISNLKFNQDIWLINGACNDIDVDYFLKYTYYSQVGDKRLNLIPLIYQAIVNEGVTYIDNETYCFARNEGFTTDEGYITIFTLSIARNFDTDHLIYQKDYLFYNTTFNEVFSSLIDENYYNGMDLIKNIQINNKNDYENIIKKDSDELIFKTNSMQIIRADMWNSRLIEHTICLNVTFADDIVINSNTEWKADKIFDVVNINGNGARIKGTTKETDEYSWLENNQYYAISNLTIDGFNHGILNKGNCILNNVNFENNHIVYPWARKDWGAGIMNLGACICYNCTFTNNVANSGGAIFNQGKITLENCSFYSNDVKPTESNKKGITTGGIGVDVCNVMGQGQVISNNKIDYDEATGLNAGERAGFAVLTVGISFFVGMALGYATGSIKIGAIAGGAVGACIGAVGSLLICSNTMDATFNELRFSLLLMAGSLTAGAIGGVVGGVIASKMKATPKEIQKPGEDIPGTGKDIPKAPIERMTETDSYFQVKNNMVKYSDNVKGQVKAYASTVLENIELEEINDISEVTAIYHNDGRIEMMVKCGAENHPYNIVYNPLDKQAMVMDLGDGFEVWKVPVNANIDAGMQVGVGP